jgi:hypothetical protein
MKKNNFTLKKILLWFLLVAAAVIFFLYWTKPAISSGDWQEQVAVLQKAEFGGDTVTIKNVRNFRYGPTEEDMHSDYYDRTYDLSQIKRVWYITEPFNEIDVAAHTFLSFEFTNGDFLGISIETRKTRGQIYSLWKGILRTYPLVYVAADERDLVFLRANVRKDKVYVYPVKFENQENARLLLVNMLETMNSLEEEPQWYNSIFANCTSLIAKHVNEITPGRISPFSWQLLLTASADELALKKGLLDTDLTIEQARQRFYVTDISQEIGDVENYSKLIRGIKE